MPKSIPASEYNPSPDAEVFETSLLGGLPLAADRIRVFAKMNPGMTTYAIAQVLRVTKSQVEAALKTKAAQQ